MDKVTNPNRTSGGFNLKQNHISGQLYKYTNVVKGKTKSDKKYHVH